MIITKVDFWFQQSILTISQLRRAYYRTLSFPSLSWSDRTAIGHDQKRSGSQYACDNILLNVYHKSFFHKQGFLITVLKRRNIVGNFLGLKKRSPTYNVKKK